jgi:hypothetical protein
MISRSELSALWGVRRQLALHSHHQYTTSGDSVDRTRAEEHAVQGVGLMSRDDNAPKGVSSQVLTPTVLARNVLGHPQRCTARFICLMGRPGKRLTRRVCRTALASRVDRRQICSKGDNLRQNKHYRREHDHEAVTQHHKPRWDNHPKSLARAHG